MYPFSTMGSCSPNFVWGGEDVAPTVSLHCLLFSLFPRTGVSVCNHVWTTRPKAKQPKMSHFGVVVVDVVVVIRTGTPLTRPQPVFMPVLIRGTLRSILGCVHDNAIVTFRPVPEFPCPV